MQQEFPSSLREVGFHMLVQEEQMFAKSIYTSSS